MSRELPLLATASVVRNLLNSKPGCWPAEPIDASKPFQWQDRRPIKPQPVRLSLEGDWHWKGKWCSDLSAASPTKVGDVFYVRETFSRTAFDEPLYRATSNFKDELITWKPSLHMPKELSRIHLEVMRVRVERACDISEGDARAEGCICETETPNPIPAKLIFFNLWQSIYGPDAWEKWVWCYDLKRIK